ncbi:hypothetical protein BDBG_16106 [Blastomyces gilchristii SLH14081]|uniref:Uncharacterized protein n=2 Tax=Blastomyces TaxID=229219 RepID=A0A179U7H3_BLAGS|nr:uncharacterized protein BDBG_16106 [Blastomyces gilchristii SLH14081]OAT03760.1 hypothetical protein BDBG_16106 [Blastomyces gilchristii SLH14081]
MDNQNTKTIEGGRMAMQEEKGREGEIEIIEMQKEKTHLDGKNRKCIAVSQLPSWLYEGSIRRTHIERMKREWTDGGQLQGIKIPTISRQKESGSILENEVKTLKVLDADDAFPESSVKEVRLKKFEPKEQRRWEVVADAA